MGIISAVFGTYSDRQLKKVESIVKSVESLYNKYKNMNDEDFPKVTQDLKGRLAKGETLDDILPDAFAAVAEASDRVLHKRHFRVQIMGGIVLHQGRIAEMKTGEGKTQTAALPAYLNALTGEGVHIVTVNDYLARYGSESMGKIYNFLGLKVGLIVHGLTNKERQDAYLADITYGTNNEMGFDYLRDNMVAYKEQMVQRGHVFGIVDEVDSILIDEARTPLIISGQGEKSTDLYERTDKLVKKFKVFKIKEMDAKKTEAEMADFYAEEKMRESMRKNGKSEEEIKEAIKNQSGEYNKFKEEFESIDYIVDEKAKTAVLTKSGYDKAEKYFQVEDLSDAENTDLNHHVNIAIRAMGVMANEVDYVVKDNEVIIVDTFTGRLMPGRRYSDGLHQAIEAKEGVKIEHESKTLATITFQNYFRLYKKLSGMTGTALTEENEFREIYGLDVVEIPTNKTMIRKNHNDVVYTTVNAKYNAIIEQIKTCNAKGQPVLVGTVSVEKSELLSSMLKKAGIKHNVLNAKYHEKEAEIVAQAGRLGTVTISTNMAGRGTDIMLGGNAEFLAKEKMRHETDPETNKNFTEDDITNAVSFFHTEDEKILNSRKHMNELIKKFETEIEPERLKVIEAGGLYILGTERHESRRIDNQLRGRSGRQGDPGEARFYLSLEDDLLRLFGSDRVAGLASRLGEDTPINARILSNTIENAQKRLEGNNFERRKQTLRYDDVMNQQRKIIYAQRRDVLDGEDLKDKIKNMIDETIGTAVAEFCSGEEPIQWNFDGLREHFREYGLTNQEDFVFEDDSVKNSQDSEEIKTMLIERANKIYDEKEKAFAEVTKDPDVMRKLERKILLDNVDDNWMDHIDAMSELINSIQLRAYAHRDPIIDYRMEGADMFDGIIRSIRETTVRKILTVAMQVAQKPIERRQIVRPMVENVGGDATAMKPKPVVKKEKVGRNDPCPCGSGKKYKKCCGVNDIEA